MDTETVTGEGLSSPEAPSAAHRDSVSISQVFHVGDLDGSRGTPHTSHEGKGVSVSVHPAAWERIIRADGTSTLETLKTYRLTNPDARFYFIDPSEPLTVEREWCIKRGFVKETVGYKVTYEDGARGEAYMKFAEEETAQLEARTRAGELEETDILTLAPAGVEYWLEAFRQPPERADPVLIAGLTPVWYAEANGYDGVWWDEEFDPKNYSVPRGVIFQSKIASWTRTIGRRTE